MVALSSFALRSHHFVVLTSLLIKTNLNPNSRIRLFSDKSRISDVAHDDHQTKLNSSSCPNTDLGTRSEFSCEDFPAVSELLKSPRIVYGKSLHAELDRAGFEPSLGLIQDVFNHFDSSPKLLHSIFLWAEKNPGFRLSAQLFGSMISVLGKEKEFDSAWSLILERTGKEDASSVISEDTFGIMIRSYARAGMGTSAVRTFEYARTSRMISSESSETNLFENFLDSLCKEGDVREASDYIDRKKKLNPGWVPSIRVYNIMLSGWFRSRSLNRAEQLWMDMKKENLKPTLATYVSLVEGYCSMRFPERAIELMIEIKAAGFELNAIVYNPIIDAFADAGKFKEASAIMERFLILKPGPTISTYNSLIKGFCKAGDLSGASKILKTMISNGFIPNTTTYNYFFRYYSDLDKVEEGMYLYTKMIESGYSLDQLTYQLLLKMLCHEGKLGLAVQLSKEMRSTVCDFDLDVSKMMIDLYCKKHKFNEAFAEFKDVVRRGISPGYPTFHRMCDELEKQEMFGMAEKLEDLMFSIPHSTQLHATYVEDDKDKDTLDSRRPGTMKKFSYQRPGELVTLAKELIEEIVDRY